MLHQFLQAVDDLLRSPFKLDLCDALPRDQAPYAARCFVFREIPVSLLSLRCDFLVVLLNLTKIHAYLLSEAPCDFLFCSPCYSALPPRGFVLYKRTLTLYIFYHRKLFDSSSQTKGAYFREIHTCTICIKTIIHPVLFSIRELFDDYPIFSPFLRRN